LHGDDRWLHFALAVDRELLTGSVLLPIADDPDGVGASQIAFLATGLYPAQLALAGLQS